MNSIVIAGVIMLTASYIGIYFKSYYKKRNELFCELLSFAKYINQRIKVTHDLIPDVIASFSSNSKALTNIIKELGVFNDKTCDLSTVFDSKFIKSEKDLLINYFDKLGKNDFDTEIKLSDVFIGELTKIQAITETEVKNKGELIFKLCIMGGILISILIV